MNWDRGQSTFVSLRKVPQTVKKIISTFLFLSFIQFSFSQGPSVHPSVLNALERNGSAEVIIQLKDAPDFSGYLKSWKKEEKTAFVFNRLKTLAQTSQSDLISFLTARKVDFRSFWIINAIKADISSDVLSELVLRKDIKAIYYNEPVRTVPAVDRSLRELNSRNPELTWGLKRIRADKVWELGIEGQGVTLAGQDTGYKWDMQGIKEKYRGWDGTGVKHDYNWHDAIHKISPLSADSLNPCGLNLKEPCDDHGHGTHTAGTMVGFSDELAYGVAPKASWMGCRNMERGNGAPDTYIECFEFFLAPTDLNGQNPNTDLAPHAINNSWYCSESEGCNPGNFMFMEEVVDHLTLAGVVVVVSAGNSGNRCGTIANPPALFKNSLTVGSFAENDTISNFSSTGPVYVDNSKRIKPDVVAPGSAVLSRPLSGNLEAWYGTSMAGPHVAGLVALIISANPALAGQVDQISEIIRLTSRAHDSELSCDSLDNSAVPNHMYGYGKIQAEAAVRMAIVLKTRDLHSLPNSFSLSPNPAQQYIRLMPLTEGTHQFRMYNALSEQVMSIICTEPEKQVYIGHLPAGVYLIRMDDQNNFQKFVKQ